MRSLLEHQVCHQPAVWSVSERVPLLTLSGLSSIRRIAQGNIIRRWAWERRWGRWWSRHHSNAPPLAPSIQATSHCRGAQHLPRLNSTSRQDGIDLHSPAVSACDLCELARPLATIVCRCLQNLAPPVGFRAHLCLRCWRLVSPSSPARAASPVAELKGCSPSSVRTAMSPEASASRLAPQPMPWRSALCAVRSAAVHIFSASPTSCCAPAAVTRSWASVIVPRPLTSTAAGCAVITVVSEDEAEICQVPSGLVVRPLARDEWKQQFAHLLSGNSGNTGTGVPSPVQITEAGSRRSGVVISVIFVTGWLPPVGSLVRCESRLCNQPHLCAVKTLWQ
jgi:hypothetical protein